MACRGQNIGFEAVILCEYTGGAVICINAITGYGNFGVVNSYPLRLVVNSQWRLRLDPDGSLTMRNGATFTTGGVWTDTSSRDLKEDINALSADQAMDSLDKLKPVPYKYEADKEDKHVLVLERNFNFCPICHSLSIFDFHIEIIGSCNPQIDQSLAGRGDGVFFRPPTKIRYSCS